MVRADGFHHLDRHELGEPPRQLAIVVAQHFDTIFETCFGHTRARVLVLFPRNGRGGDPTARLTRGVNGEAAPAAADLEQMVR